MSDFGSTFKKARESMGLTLEQIAAETRIGTRFLEAIENEQLHLLPGGIFSRGFVRSYAERLKLDPDKAVADFERQSSYREPALIEDLNVSAPPPRKSNRSLYTIAIGALVALVAIFYVVTRESTKSVSAGQPPVHAAPAVASPPAPEPPPQAATPAASSPSSEAASPPAPAPTTAVAPAPEAPKGTMTIVVSARAVTWVKILADGKTVNAGEILQPGTTRQYTAQSSIGVTLGNAGGVDLQVNDHTLRPLGKDGQVRSVTITPDNLKDLL
jgi:cytoskeletal protein RodZ